MIFQFRIKQDLQTYVVVAAAVSSASALASATAALRCSAVILVGLAASALASIASTRRIFSSAAVLCPGGLIIVCHDLGEILQLGVAPGLCVSYNQMHAQYTCSSYLLLAHLATRSHTDGEQS